MNQSNKKNYFKILLLVFNLCFLPGNQNRVSSQTINNSYFEVGSNYASAGFYGSLSTQFSQQFGNFEASAGGLFTLSNAQSNIFSALKLGISNNFQLKNRTLNVGAFYLFKPFSRDLNESNFAIFANYRTSHFGYILGLNSRIYSFNRSAIQKYNFPDSIKTSIWEPYNLMYRISYFHDIVPKLNFEASITNYDQYLIQQETNPMLQVNFNYQLNNKLQLYSELTYMQAGMLNIRINYFGLYLKGGVIWQLN